MLTLFANRRTCRVELIDALRTSIFGQEEAELEIFSIGLLGSLAKELDCKPFFIQAIFSYTDSKLPYFALTTFRQAKFCVWRDFPWRQNRIRLLSGDI